ncbi:hypothetical protein W97_08426 [Coniosporium apollinis CBS 100218]|uniref:Uncharacterized protein n=1 Tax=Coniosporium apollinis (strain CBS 100218) TaxID=1168221 RepID=R7Z5R9_CONA1|nr:uncharacterized protein W97_08426 [Coniosporium apollinis CBS 100218]EON69266.1 hypothetical protein W97_08426 [Coniosporium apollinis CBS 100218]
MRKPTVVESTAVAKPDAKGPKSDVAEVSKKEDVSQPEPTTGPSKRQHPGKLDINAATQSTIKESASDSAKADTPATKGAVMSATPSVLSRPTTPAAIATGSPMKRTTAPRTLRVLPTPTPKTEAPPPLSSASAQQPPLPAVISTRLPSRQPSIASVNLPGTPASELISDNASVTSASVSRASSPPPMLGGRVGSAPIRKKTKSQAKKDRQERAKQIQEEKDKELAETAETPVEEEVEHAPIIGRKKKAKKPATSRGGTATNTPDISRPASPGLVERDEGLLETTEKATTELPTPPPAKVALRKESPAKEAPPVATEDKDRPAEKSVQTAASVLTSLQASGELLAATVEAMFKTPVAGVLQSSPQRRPPGPSGRDSNAHNNVNLLASFAEPMPPLSEPDMVRLAAGIPVRLNQKGPRSLRTLITPGGKILRALSEDEENRFLELERSVKASIHDIGHFNPSSRNGGDPLNVALDKASRHPRGFSAAVESLASALGDAALGFGGDADKRRDNAALAQAALDQATANKFEDDAMAYVNQFVLPTLPSQAPPTSSVRADNPVLPPVGGVASGGYHAPAAADNGAGQSAFLDQAGFGLQVSVAGQGEGHWGGGPVLSVAEAEAALGGSRREAEKLEKQLNALIKKNRRLVFGGH